MSAVQCFERSEIKYLLTREQYGFFTDRAAAELMPDEYPKCSIRSLYFDTPDYLLITRSCEQPEYKEKIRLRAYSDVTPQSAVFAELKKKYDSVVYKRRTSLAEKDAVKWLEGKRHFRGTQIEREIDSFAEHYKTLRPAALVFCDRLSFVARSNPDLRITFDMNVKGRLHDLSLTRPVYGEELCPGRIIMEIKAPGAVPVWLAKILSEGKIYKTSFSKYGTLYLNSFGAARNKGETDNVCNF